MNFLFKCEDEVENHTNVKGFYVYKFVINS